jgi:hypothetical protein
MARIRQYENLMGGTSTIVPAGTLWSLVPEEVRGAVSAEERSAFENPRDFFVALSARTEFPPLARCMRELARMGRCDLEDHRSEFVGDAVLLRFRLPKGMNPAVGLPRKPLPTGLPDVLRQVYGIISETKHGPWEESGGLYRLEPGIRFDIPLSMSTESDVAAHDCVPIYDTSEGDMLCWHVPDGTAVWYPHDEGCLLRIGSLRKHLERYFELLIEGEELRQGGWA